MFTQLYTYMHTNTNTHDSFIHVFVALSVVILAFSCTCVECLCLCLCLCVCECVCVCACWCVSVEATGMAIIHFKLVGKNGVRTSFNSFPIIFRKPWKISFVSRQEFLWEESGTSGSEIRNGIKITTEGPYLAHYCSGTSVDGHRALKGGPLAGHGHSSQ